MSRISDITALVKTAAREAGFDLAGIAAVADFPELGRISDWIAQGRAGEMKYMEARDEKGGLKRSSLRSVAHWARSVVVCAINYNTAQPYSTEVNDSERGWISRYAWSREDYHDAVMRRLRVVEGRIREVSTEYRVAGTEQDSTRYPVANTQENRAEPAVPCTQAGQELQTRCYVDTGPIVERVYAKYAGVGWIGKNTCILNQKLGSWLFLGVILTSLELEPDLPAPDRCGTCTRCIDACPTDAFVGPYQLDSNRCISYLTIEKRGPIPEAMRAGMERQVFGCDICQDVCPWNRKAPATDASEFQPRPELVNPALDWLAEMQSEEFRKVFRGSPVRRTKLSGLRRNAVIAMGNSGNRGFLPILERLAAETDESVAEAASWAVATLTRK